MGRLTSYQWRLFIFLGVATFFEGYDFIAISQLLPELGEEFGLSDWGKGALGAFINVGTILAYLMIRKADQWGRRRVLTITIVGYTAFTCASGLAPDVYTFAAAQFLARIFLIAEWGISMVYAAEEFPAERRGMVIGVLGALSTLGAIVCAGAVPLLVKTPWGWRTVYLVAVIPLVLLAIFRRSLRESKRFTAVAEAAGAGGPTRRPFIAILRGPYCKRLLLVALIWGLAYTCANTGVYFFKQFAVDERQFTDGEVGQAIMISALLAMPMMLAVGPLIDRFGRRRGALVIFVLGIGGIVGSYNFHSWPAITGALIFGVFGVTAIPAVLNMFTTELFPTELRADAYAWANNLLGRIGYVLTPLAVGAAAGSVGYSISVTATAVFPILALVLIMAYFPETTARELEETAAL